MHNEKTVKCGSSFPGVSLCGIHSNSHQPLGEDLVNPSGSCLQGLLLSIVPIMCPPPRPACPLKHLLSRFALLSPPCAEAMSQAEEGGSQFH